MRPPTRTSTSRWSQAFTLFAVLALAFNLRTAAASLGVVLTYVQEEFDLSAATAGILVTLPVLCFAAFGSTTGGLARALGIHRTMLLGFLLIATGSILGRSPMRRASSSQQRSWR